MKKLSKPTAKLLLSVTTIRDLSGDQLKNAIGGALRCTNFSRDTPPSATVSQDCNPTQ